MTTTAQPWAVDSPWLRSLLAGGIAGTTVDLSLYPLDTLKTRLQSHAGFFPSGGFKQIYRGVGSALIGSAPGAALFFVTYDSTKRTLLKHAQQSGFLSSALADGPTTARLANGKKVIAEKEVDPRAAALVHMLAASMGETAACIVRVPTEVVKQRAQASQHPSSLSALMHILRSHRGLDLVREMYRGGGITLLREIPFTIIQFPLWEALKAWHVRRFAVGNGHGVGTLKETSGSSNAIPALPAALYGSLSGAIAAGITTPLDVLKTRLMLSRERVSAGAMLQQILRDSGPRAFFAGFGPRIMWISAGGAIFLGSYQWAHNMLGGQTE